MNWIVYHVISGLSFFTGMGLCAAGVILVTVLRKRWGCLMGGILVVSGTVLAGVSSTPVNTGLKSLFHWSLTVWTFVVAIQLLLEKLGRAAIGLCIIVVSLAGTMVAMELPWHLSPRIPESKFDVVYVIGDSISSGVGQERKTWPEIIAHEHNVYIKNLAVGGATTESARQQVGRVEEERALILLEIGGNDMLHRLSADKFHQGLEQLLKKVKSPQRQLVMLELPLRPLCADYGRAQRELADEYNVTLIPKRYFARVFLGDDRVLGDKIHLTDEGHRVMAETIWGIIKPVMQVGESY